jgi:hypothetical protein
MPLERDRFDWAVASDWATGLWTDEEPTEPYVHPAPPAPPSPPPLPSAHAASPLAKILTPGDL